MFYFLDKWTNPEGKKAEDFSFGHKTLKAIGNGVFGAIVIGGGLMLAGATTTFAAPWVAAAFGICFLARAVGGEDSAFMARGTVLGLGLGIACGGLMGLALKPGLDTVAIVFSKAGASVIGGFAGAVVGSIVASEEVDDHETKRTLFRARRRPALKPVHV